MKEPGCTHQNQYPGNSSVLKPEQICPNIKGTDSIAGVSAGVLLTQLGQDFPSIPKFQYVSYTGLWILRRRSEVKQTDRERMR